LGGPNRRLPADGVFRAGTGGRDRGDRLAGPLIQQERPEDAVN
jgi:hypothetical protein